MWLLMAVQSLPAAAGEVEILPMVMTRKKTNHNTGMSPGANLLAISRSRAVETDRGTPGRDVGNMR